MIDEEKEYEASGRKVKVEVNGGSLDTGTDSTGGDNGAVMYEETEYEAGGRNVKVEVMAVAWTLGQTSLEMRTALLRQGYNLREGGRRAD